MILESIFIAVNNKKINDSLSEYLKRNGYDVFVYTHSNALLKDLRQRKTDLLIVDDELKGLAILDFVHMIHQEKIAPVILIQNKARTNYVDWIQKGWIYSIAHNHMSLTEWDALIKGAIYTGDRIRRLEQKVLKLQKSLEERKVIEKAKGMLMEKKNWSEQAAYEYIRKSSMDHKVTMEQFSKAVLRKLEE